MQSKIWNFISGRNKLLYNPLLLLFYLLNLCDLNPTFTVSICTNNNLWFKLNLWQNIGTFPHRVPFTLISLFSCLSSRFSSIDPFTYFREIP